MANDYSDNAKKYAYFFVGIVTVILVVMLLSILLDNILYEGTQTPADEVVFDSMTRPEQIFGSGLGAIPDSETIAAENILPPTIDERIVNFYVLSSYLSDAVLIRLQDAIITFLGGERSTTVLSMGEDYFVDISTRIMTFRLYDDRGALVGNVSFKIESGASISDVQFTFPGGHSSPVPY